MSDIYCALCGEPWDAYGVTHGDMEKWEASKFRKGEGCPSCDFGKNTEGRSPDMFRFMESADSALDDFDIYAVTEQPVKKSILADYMPKYPKYKGYTFSIALYRFCKLYAYDVERFADMAVLLEERFKRNGLDIPTLATLEKQGHLDFWLMQRIVDKLYTKYKPV